MYYYNARWYDPQLGRFAQADTIVPGGVQGLDRYAYVNNNPLKYNDPSGHDAGFTQYLSPAECLNKSGYTDEAKNEIANALRPQYSVVENTKTPTQNPTYSAFGTEVAQYSSNPHNLTLPTMTPKSTYYPGPTFTPTPTKTPTPGSGLQALAEGIREGCGAIDPFLYGETTGSSLTINQLQEQAAQYAQTVFGTNKMNPFIFAAPGVCFTYDVGYDNITNTGEYSDISPLGIVDLILFAIVITSIP